MPGKFSFFPYSPSGQDRVHVLFQPTGSEWIAVNKTTLEIARSLELGESPDEAALQLVRAHGITEDAARADVLRVAHELRRQGFLVEEPRTITPRVPRLNLVYVHLTEQCNLRCPQCYVSTANGMKPSDLPVKVVYRLIDELVDNGGNEIALSGGEPLLHPEIKSILQYAASKLKIRLLTNGTLLDRQWASVLADKDIRVQISLDGSRREIHDAIRGKGTFEKVLRAVTYLQEVGLGPRLNFSCTVMEQNLKDIPNIIALTQETGVPLVRFLPIRMAGRASRRWPSIGEGVRLADYEALFGQVFDIRKHGPSPVDITCGLSGFLLKITDSVSDDDIWCPVGKQLVVGSDGDTFPCVLLMRPEYKLGNIYNDSLADMIHANRMAEICAEVATRRTRIAKCARCSFKNLCQAGCMGQALADKGTVRDVDDFCNFRQRAYSDAFDKLLCDFDQK